MKLLTSMPMRLDFGFCFVTECANAADVIAQTLLIIQGRSSVTYVHNPKKEIHLVSAIT